MERFEMTTALLSAHHPSRARIRFSRLFARAASNTSGAAAIEFGLVVPILALMVTAAIDIGLGVNYKLQVEDAAQAGAAWAIRNGFDVNAISSAVTGATGSSMISASPAPVQFCGCATGSSVSSATCGTTCPGGAQAATYVNVFAQRTYNTILSYPALPSGYNLTAQSTARLQ
jgi:Flp pilus assembly protein TadG